MDVIMCKLILLGEKLRTYLFDIAQLLHNREFLSELWVRRGKFEVFDITIAMVQSIDWLLLLCIAT